MSSKTGAAAFGEVWPRIDGLPYRGWPAGNGPSHMFWGLDLKDYEGYAIMTGNAKNVALERGYQFLPPIEKLALQCTSFATLVMVPIQPPLPCGRPQVRRSLRFLL